MMIMNGFLVMLLTIYTTNCAKWDSRFPLILVGYKETAVMTCTVDLSTFDGFYDNNGTKITPQAGRYLVIEDTDNSKMKLEILNVVESDFGKYFCVDGASNETIELEISVTIPALNDLFKLAIGDTGVVEAAVYAMPKHQIDWVFTKAGTSTPIEIATLSAEGEMKKGSPQYDISTRGSLTISKVTSEHAGQYEIRVESGSKRITRSTTVQVGDKPILTSTPNDMYTVTQYLDLKIPCQWSGELSEKWYFQAKNSANKTELVENVDETGISLKNVTADNEGTYFCEATNEYGLSVSKTELKQVIVPAELVGSDREFKAPADEPFSFSCESTGIPTPNIIISKRQRDGSFVTVQSGSSKVERKFEKVSVSDKGLYRCEAENGAKNKDGVSLKVSQTISIDVLTRPTIILADTTSKITSAVGLSFSVKCAAQGNPEPNVTMSMGDTVYASEVGNSGNAMVTAQYTIQNAEEKHFGMIKCMAVNTQGQDTYSIEIFRVVKANPPGGLRLARDVPGLEYIDLKWNESQRAERYIVYVNNTREEKASINQITIKGLKRSTYYRFEVAAVNLAGVGNRSKAIIVKTSDIKRPGPVSGANVEDVTSTSATISWTDPTGIPDSGIITYKVQYCTVNTTKPVCREKKESKDRKAELKNLDRGTTYRIKIIAVNQGVEGEEFIQELTTKNTKPPPPSKSGKLGGLSTGAIAGVVIAIILIILIVIDLFCCFFNNCGFSHCCFETFCAPKSKKYAPADTKDEEQEMKPAQNETV